MTTPKITRRGLIAVFGVGAMAWASAVYGQDQKRPARIGILPLGSPTNKYDQSLVEAFRKGLLQVGLVEHRDFVLDVEWIVGDPEEAVAGLLRRGVDMLVPCGTSASLAAKRKATNLPILFISVGNPLGIGLVPSLSHP